MFSRIPLLFVLLLGAFGGQAALAQPTAPAADEDKTTLYWSMERLLVRASHPDEISLDLKVDRKITVEVPGAKYHVNTVAEILEVLPNDQYRVRVGEEVKIYRGKALRQLNLPYLLTDGTRVMGGGMTSKTAIMKIDRANDPALRAFLAEAVKIGNRMLTSEASKLERLVNLVNQNVRYPGSEAPNRAPYDELERKYRAKEVHFGEYLKIGQGVCRHKAVAMKLALEAIGYPSRYVSGQAISRSTGESRGGHAWVEAITKSGKRLMIDPTWHDPGIALRDAYNSKSLRRPRPGNKRILAPGQKMPSVLGDLAADMLEPYRRNDGTVDWKRITREKGARELRGLGHFTLALFLKELAVVAQTGDRLRIEEFFDALMTSDFYAEYGLFALGARAGEVAYVRYLQRYVKPRFVNGILKTNLVLATGLALPQLVAGTFEGKAFAISLGSLGLSSAAVKTGARGLAWVKELSSTRRVAGAASVGRAVRLAKLGGFFYTAAELAVVLYLAEEIEGRVNAYLDARTARAALAAVGQAVFRAGRDPNATPESVAAAVEAYHEAWNAYRDFLYRPLLAEDLRLASRLEKSAEAAKVVADRRKATVERVATRAALRANIERRYGSLEKYAQSLAERDEAAIGRDVDAALAAYSRARQAGLKALYEGERRPGIYLGEVESLDYLTRGKNDPWRGRSDLFARRGRDRLQASFVDALARPSTNKLQTYEDEAAALNVLRRALAGRPSLTASLESVEARLARQRQFDTRLARGDSQIDLGAKNQGAASRLRQGR
ncbi:MAG: hypothetical protein JKY65_22905 [Planctomycetes bacterium]|nr:hypothetical protein [Planctomycetota bacterium]